MDLGLKDTVAVVIGAAHGIGHAVASAFASEGAHVACVDRDEKIDAIATEIAADYGTKVEGFTADVTNYEQMCDVVGQIESKLGRHDHVICTAGMGSGKYGFPFWNLEPADWDNVLRVNLTGMVNIAHAFTPGLVERRAGSFQFYSSVAGQIGSQTDPPYSVSKAGVINFMQCMAKDLGSYGVRVNAICPGMVKTDLNQSVWQAWTETTEGRENPLTYEAWADEKIRKVCPLGRWQEAEDMAAMTVFLASQRARMVTGQTINVDGGFVMHA